MLHVRPHAHLAGLPHAIPAAARACLQDLDELQTHILLKRWVKDTGQDVLLEKAAAGAEVAFGLDAMLQVGPHVRPAPSRTI